MPRPSNLGRLREVLIHPARMIPLAFLAMVVADTLLLSRLLATENGACRSLWPSSPPPQAPFGEAVIPLLFQVGGFGIMTEATLLGLLVSRRLRLFQRLIAQAETRSLTLGDVGSVAGVVLAVTVAVELLVAVALTYACALPTANPGRTRFGAACSTRFRPSTMRASSSTPTASWTSRCIRPCASP